MTSPSDQEKIPFVFLPLASGHAVYPSARIRISNGEDSDLIPSLTSSSFISGTAENTATDNKSNVDKDNEPICVVSSTDMMYRGGWNNLEKIYNSFSFPGTDAKTETSNNFYHHPLRLVQQPNAKTSLQVM